MSASKQRRLFAVCRSVWSRRSVQWAAKRRRSGEEGDRGRSAPRRRATSGAGPFAADREDATKPRKSGSRLPTPLVCLRFLLFVPLVNLCIKVWESPPTKRYIILLRVLAENKTVWFYWEHIHVLPPTVLVSWGVGCVSIMPVFVLHVKLWASSFACGVVAGVVLGRLVLRDAGAVSGSKWIWLCFVF